MSDINVSSLPVITAATDDDMIIINDANAVTSIISWERLTSSISNLTAAQVSFSAGSAIAPSIIFEDDTNTGLYQPDVDSIAISTGGVSRLVVAPNGSVGINNDNPSQYNSGANNLVIGSELETDTGITLVTSPTGDNVINFADGTGLSSAVGQIIYDHDNNNLRFNTTGTEAYRVDNSQNVIIGALSSDPTSRLTVVGGSVTIEDGFLATPPTNSRPGFNFRSDLDTGIWRPADNNLAVVTAGEQRMVIDENGNLGLGLGDPLADIHINKPDATIIITDSDAVGAPQAKVSAADGSLQIRADDEDVTSDSKISLFVDGDELVRLVETGEVIVPNQVVFNDAEDDVADPFARIGRGISVMTRGLDGELVLEADPSDLYPNSAVRIKIDDVDSFLLNDEGDVKLLADGKIIFDEDLDTYIEHPAADTLTITTGGVTAITAEPDGSVKFGPLGKVNRTAGRFTFGLPDPIVVGGQSHEFQLAGNAGNYGYSLSMFGSGADSQYISFLKSAGDGTTQSIISTNDAYGKIAFYGDNGVDYNSKSAEIGVIATGTVSATSMPGTITLSTTAVNEVTPTEHLRISPTGALGLSGSNFGSEGQIVISNGSGSAPTWGDIPPFDISILPDLP